ncbi:MAG: xanthine dehydrogenase molybdenum-binding subunit XdhA [Sarcina sp.]
MDYSKIGTDINRVDAFAKVTGKAKYAGDFFEPEVLVGKVLRSPYAHALIKSIDTTEAEKLEGVEAVLTHKNVPQNKFATAGHPYSLDPSHRDIEDRMLITDKARFVGDVVAAVVAKDELIAKKALKLIKVEYEVLPFVLDQKEAIKEGAPVIHEERPNNVIGDFGFNVGDIDKVFEDADRVFEHDYETQIVQHSQLELHNALAKRDENGRLLVITSTQIPHIVRRIVAHACGLPIGEVRVIKPFIGGGFGGKQDVVIEPLTAAMCLAVDGRPVRYTLTREEDIIDARTRHAMKMNMKFAIKDNKLKGYEIHNFVNNGAYASHGHSIALSAGSKIRAFYDIDAEKYVPKTIYTNLPVAGAMRGYGIPQITFAIESCMDDIAKELDLDPVDFRLDSLIKEGFRDKDNKLYVRSFVLPECIKKGRELIDWDRKRELYKNNTGDKRRGVGMACFSYYSGTYPVALEAAGVRIVMNQDGTVQVQMGATEIGQGSDTVFTQMVAEAIGIDVKDVFVISTQDTDVTPFDTGSYASRQSYIAGHGMKKAALEIRRKILDIASEKCGVFAEDLDIVDGKVVEKECHERVWFTVKEIATEAYYNKDRYAPITSDITVKVRNNSIAHGVTFTEVEVDMKTGRIEILDMYSIFDSGKILNRKTAEGQVHGGVSMSLGFALSEKLLFNKETGAPFNNNLLHYKIETMMDSPDMKAEFVEKPDPTSSFGQKSLGENTTISPAPAIRNAVLNATGIAFNKLPMDPQSVFEKFKEVGIL